MSTKPSAINSALPSAWELLVNIIDPMTPLTAAQAAPLLRRDAVDLEYAQESSPDFVPYEKTPIGRCFRLGDVLTVLAKDAGWKMPVLKGKGAISREEAESALKRRVGPPPQWYRKDNYSSEDKVPESQSKSVFTPGRPRANLNSKRSRGRPTKLKAKTVPRGTGILGVRVNELRGFSSLGDFVLNALPDDIWIVAKPPYGRPYDFLDSLAAEDGAPWQNMTLIEYLDAIRTGAEQDKGSQEAADGAQALRRHIKKKP